MPILLHDLPQPALLAAALILGLLVGSFLNVVAYRLPLQLQRTWRREALAWLAGSDASADAQPQPPTASAADTEPFNLLVPRSRCPRCGTGIAAHDNLPVLSWLWLRGRCRHCQAAISWRYPLVELASGALAVLVVAEFDASAQGLAALVLVWTLLVLTLIDCDHQLLPDAITLPLLWLGLLLNVAELFAPLASAVIGAVVGYLLLWSVYWLFRLATGREGMGYGDFKLLAAFGAWFGWEALPALLLVASASGALYGTAAILLRRQGREVPFAFGPFLALAGVLVLFLGETLDAWFALLG
ncbi:MAG TPA: A24 family peptidase [Porticoccaceae bacterium]|nr:A24 family peptidase [Porticoccaceae bacterium]